VDSTEEDTVLQPEAAADAEVNEFDLQLQSWDFKLKDAEGVYHHYVMTEIVGKERDAYLNTLAPRFEVTKEGSKVKNFTGMQSSLLFRCIKYKGTDAAPISPPKAVTENTIGSWPARVQDALHTKAQKLSGLDKMATEEAKNA
jgi:hypothetical protein